MLINWIHRSTVDLHLRFSRKPTTHFPYHLSYVGSQGCYSVSGHKQGNTLDGLSIYKTHIYNVSICLACIWIVGGTGVNQCQHLNPHRKSKLGLEPGTFLLWANSAILLIQVLSLPTWNFTMSFPETQFSWVFHIVHFISWPWATEHCCCVPVKYYW